MNVSSLPVLQLSSDGWKLETRQIDSCLNDPQSPRLQYLLMQEDVFSTGKEFPPELSQYFHISQHLFSSVYRRSNGFFTFEESLDQNGQLQAHRTWLRVLTKDVGSDPSKYKWHEMTFCSCWRRESCVILCIGVDLTFQQRLRRILSQIWSKSPHCAPYSLHVPLLEAIIETYDSSVWSIRDTIRGIEKNRSKSNHDFRNFSIMHEAARHAIHSFETLSVSVETLEALQQQIFDLFSQDKQEGEKIKAITIQIRKHVEFQIRTLRNLFLRSQSNKERLQNEISLAYNLIAQRDNQIMKELGKASTIDSEAMRTIAVVTMAFLPPTFLSAIFGMSFFDYTPGEGVSEGRWSISEKFWVYWVCAAPLTCLTMAIWYWRQKQKGQ